MSACRTETFGEWLILPCDPLRGKISSGKEDAGGPGKTGDLFKASFYGGALSGSGAEKRGVEAINTGRNWSSAEETSVNED